MIHPKLFGLKHKNMQQLQNEMPSIIRGKIVLDTIDTRNIETGTIGLIAKDNRYYRVFVTHANMDKDWVVDGDYKGSISRDKSLLRLCVRTETGLTCPINMAELKTILKQDLIGKDRIKFNIKPYKFKEGKYSCVCTDCNAYFPGSRSQPFCRKCCTSMSTAYLFNAKKTTKSKPTTISIDSAKVIARNATNINFAAHKEDPDDVFDDWFNEQLKKWQ